MDSGKEVGLRKLEYIILLDDVDSGEEVGLRKVEIT